MIRSSRTALALMAVASSMPVTISIANAGEDAGTSSYSSLAQREMIRRQEAVTDGDRLLAEGREAYAKGDFQTAVDKYRQALDRLPDAPTLADRRASYTAHLTDASVALAQKNRKEGKLPEARALLENVLSPSVDPNNALAKQELDYLDDPIRTNPASTYEHTQNVDKVRKGLYMAEGNYNLGKYDEAKANYEDVLRIDPYNSAARRGMEKIAATKTDYYRAAYDQTRAELLMQVDAAWELTVPAQAPTLINDQGPIDTRGGSALINEKLRRIIIPQIDFEDATVDEAIEFLRQRAAELDTTELDPTKKGINFVVRQGSSAGGAADAGLDAGATGGLGGGSDSSALRISNLRLTNVPLATALKYICDATKLRIKVDDYAVTLLPATSTGEDVVSRNFQVSPDFGAKLSAGVDSGGSGAAADDPFADNSNRQPSLVARPSIQELLKKAGVSFPDGTSANLSGSGILVVRNTSTELDKVEQLVEAYSEKSPKQVNITTKFVEISQENTDELGFDWLVSPFGLNANSVFASGGTIGNGAAKIGSDFVSAVGSQDGLLTTVSGISGSSDNVTNIVTGGLRSGDSAISSDGIDAILNNPNRTSESSSAAPGIMALTGLFSDGQVQMIMRGLAQKKGTDLMTAPSITARSTEKATIEIIREFIYPTEYEPPELPNSVDATGGTTSVGLGGSSSGIFPVTPATPTAFETRNTGVTLEIEPTIGANDLMIDLRFAPEIVEFEGFINYGSPIQSPSSNVLGEPVTVTITDNRIEMPVFSSRRVSTALTIFDGYTVAVGGLMREDVQHVEDKVPIFGDIPIVGRLFQSKSENRIKSNLIVFVTAKIIDPTGTAVRKADEVAAMPASTDTMDGSLLGGHP
ncbi:type II and III secretion system protein [Luteolibacter pohnpeiensis]|uniref:Type II and III secretion system protein n=2 Tax=Luteolibacter pohnpeiensis TaxID=454153 RepID=A0A934VV51_9BACT|nr:type II and III secretion system protein [Luteolibacter pohnpeiensis]